MLGDVIVQRRPSSGGPPDWWRFRHPREVVTTTSLADVISRLRRVEELVQTHAWFAAGFLAYEAAPAFDAAHRVRPVTAPNVPLLWFGLYDNIEPFEPPDDFDRAVVADRDVA